jgi:hypothetical protein
MLLMRSHFLLLATLYWGVARANPDAKRLYDDLLSNYNRLIRPVSNHTDKVTVKLGLRLSQLVDLVSIQLAWHLNICRVFLCTLFLF